MGPVTVMKAPYSGVLVVSGARTYPGVCSLIVLFALIGPAEVKVRAGNAFTGRGGLVEGHDLMNGEARV